MSLSSILSLVEDCRSSASQWAWSGVVVVTELGEDVVLEVVAVLGKEAQLVVVTVSGEVVVTVLGEEVVLVKVVKVLVASIEAILPAN